MLRARGSLGCRPPLANCALVKHGRRQGRCVVGLVLSSIIGLPVFGCDGSGAAKQEAAAAQKQAENERQRADAAEKLATQSRSYLVVAVSLSVVLIVLALCVGCGYGASHEKRFSPPVRIPVGACIRRSERGNLRQINGRAKSVIDQ